VRDREEEEAAVRHVVCKVSELRPGEKREARVGNVPVVVVRTPSGEFRVLANKCLHMGGPLSKGLLWGLVEAADGVGTYRYTREGEILHCPWHGFEYDTVDGRLLAEPERRLRCFTVRVEGEDVVVYS
jgi:nitrite reductase/ring-hydroxylating ferredoxin subunit